MPLPNTHMPDKQQWQLLHDQAETDDGRAIVGAIMLLAVDIRELHDAISQAAQQPEQRSSRRD